MIVSRIRSLMSLVKLFAFRCCSSWTVHRIVRSLCKFSAFVGTVVFCMFVILGKYEAFNYPLLATVTICSFLYVSPPNKRMMNHQESYNGFFEGFKRGDPNMTGITILLVFIPTLGYLTLSLKEHLKGATFTLEDFPHKHIANVFGKTSAMAMSFFLIPVSKHSLILKALCIDPTHALRLHTSAGFVATGTGLIHGIYWFWIWIFIKQEDLWSLIMPPTECWSWVNTQEMAQECNAVFVQFTGVLLGISFIILTLSSLWWVRRRFYTFFITTHITFACIILYLLVMHYRKMILYIAPSLLYYLASSMPIWIEAVKDWMSGGVFITNVKHIPNADGCVEISLLNESIKERYNYDPVLMLQMNCGKYVKICVPEISKVWHPFSFYHFNDSHDIKLMLKCNGPFTKALSQRLSNASETSYPKILVEGFHGGENLLTQASRHKTVVILAGGVGMTSYLTLLSMLCSSGGHTNGEPEDTTYQNSTQEQRCKKILVHWFCRDEGLIAHFNECHFKKLKDNNCSEGNLNSFPDIQLFIHHTTKNNVQTTRSNQGEEIEIQNSLQQNAFNVGLFSWGKKGYLFENTPQSIVFSCMLWSSQWLVELFYNNFHGKTTVVYTRTFVILAIVALMAVLPLLYFLLLRLYAICYRFIGLCKYQHLIIEKDSVIEIPIDKTSMGTFSESLDESQSCCEVKIEHHNGRPDINAVINEICDNEDDIGLFMCLPSFLKQSIKDKVLTKRCGRGRCAVYEEISEL